MRRIMFLDPESISEVKFAARGILVPFRGRHLVFAGVMPLELRRIEEFFSFPDFFFAIFADIKWKLGLFFCSKMLQFQFAFQCD
jgi:hypothetical protein